MAEYIVGTDEHEGHWYTGERVVRCRDCKHEGTSRLIEVGWRKYRIIECEGVDPNGFCAWGERREDG